MRWLDLLPKSAWVTKTQYPWLRPDGKAHMPIASYTWSELRQPLRTLDRLHNWGWGWAYALKGLWCHYVLAGGRFPSTPTWDYVVVAITMEPRYSMGAAIQWGGDPYDWEELHVGHGWRRGTWWAQEVSEGNY